MLTLGLSISLSHSTDASTSAHAAYGAYAPHILTVGALLQTALRVLRKLQHCTPVVSFCSVCMAVCVPEDACYVVLSPVMHFILAYKACAAAPMPSQSDKKLRIVHTSALLHTVNLLLRLCKCNGRVSPTVDADVASQLQCCTCRATHRPWQRLWSCTPSCASLTPTCVSPLLWRSN